MSFKFTTARTLLDRIFDLAYFHEEDGAVAIPYHRVDGRNRLIVIVGENASGKSFFRRIVQSVCRKNKIECIPISAEGRRQIAYSPWLTFVYGDESYEATGVNSTNTVLSGIKTCRGREEKHVIFWDEPDLGLSDSWAAGVGQQLCKFAQDLPEKTVAAFVVSHNRALVRELLPAEPFYLHLGVDTAEAPATLQQWINKPCTPRDPELLLEMGHKRFQMIQHILDLAKP